MPVCGNLSEVFAARLVLKVMSYADYKMARHSPIPECKTSVWLGGVAHPVSEACTGHSLAFACPVALVGVNHACGLHVAATRKRYAERSQGLHLMRL